MRAQKRYDYRVVLDIPNVMKTHGEAIIRNVPNQEEAKCRASKIFFNHLYTGTFKYMKATRINR